MTVWGNLRGHEIYWDGEDWRYVDTDQPTTAVQERSCAKCGKRKMINGHDPCIANLPGVANACCGHGKQDESYIVFDNGVIVRGFKVTQGPT